MNLLLSFNQNGLDTLNSLLVFPAMGILVPIFSDLPIFFLPIFLVSAWIYYGVKKDRSTQESLIYIFISCIIGISISLIIQQFFHFDRPSEHIKNAANLILHKIPEASFPSDHATISIAFLSSLYFWNFKRVFWNIVPFIIVMNLCRIIVGVHWPLDIIVGTGIGVLSGYLGFRFVTKIKFVKKLNSFIIQVSSLLRL